MKIAKLLKRNRQANNYPAPSSAWSGGFIAYSMQGIERLVPLDEHAGKKQ
jgi:hypothetical protein